MTIGRNSDPQRKHSALPLESAQTRDAKCHRYGRYICVKELTVCGKILAKTQKIAKSGDLKLDLPKNMKFFLQARLI